MNIEVAVSCPLVAGVYLESSAYVQSPWSRATARRFNFVPMADASLRVHRFDPSTIGNMVEGIFGESEHAARVRSLSSAVCGTMEAASTSIQLIGQGLARSMGISTNHATKHVDRLLSNEQS